MVAMSAECGARPTLSPVGGGGLISGGIAGGRADETSTRAGGAGAAPAAAVAAVAGEPDPEPEPERAGA